MKINKNIFLIFLIAFSFLLFIYKSRLRIFNLFKNSLNTEQKSLIKKLIPKQISIKGISTLSSFEETKFKEDLKDIKIKRMEDLLIKDEMKLLKYKFKNGFYSGIYKEYPGSGYIDFYKNNLIVLSARGIVGFSPDLEKELYFTQIKNNIEKYIGFEQFSKGRSFSIKDFTIIDNNIFVSYSEEIKENCWNTSIIVANMNFKKLEFKKFYSPNECIHSKNNPDNQFNALQSGGRIIKFDKNNIIFTLGDYRSRYLAQDRNSVNGKIIKININNKKVELISMGHRNPQGIFLDKDNKILLETEHGPQGGDEINLINISDMYNKKLLNYGWAISSTGEHYGGRNDANQNIYKKYPLHNSHKKFGFIEPLKSFVPSIGISEITKINRNRYLVSSLKAKSIYLFKLDRERKISSFDEINIGERIRDILFKKNRLYLFLEDSPSIGIINF